MANSEQLSDAGVMGLCPAGCALALRLAARGLRVSLWDASACLMEEFVSGNDVPRGGLVGYANDEDFLESLSRPRRIAVFETKPAPLAAPVRASLLETDRLLEFPWCDEAVTPDDLDQLEMTLLFQLA